QGFIDNGAVLIEARIHARRSEFNDLEKSDFLIPSETSEVVLIVEGKKLLLCKDILAHHSPYFDALFNGNLIESKEMEMEIKDVVYEDFLILLNLIYGNDEMSYYHCRKFLPLADRFDCKKIKYDFQMHAIGFDGLYLRVKLGLASEFRLGFLLDHCMALLDRSTKILKLMKWEDYDKLTDEIKEELEKKLNILKKTEVNDADFHRDLAVMKIAGRMYRRSFSCV
ncbi:hypothetical protein PENTCL1PPCAC_23287, partial [Pristionchus entomophagus]